jgi:hypothetical protein
MRMSHGYRSTAHRLWESAPYWRGTVVAAIIFSVLALIRSTGEPSSKLPIPPPIPDTPHVPEPSPIDLPLDPISEGRLKEYESAYKEALKITQVGAQCEAIADAIKKLQPSDISSGRSVVLSSKERLAVLAAGETCRDDLKNSDQRFAALEHAVSSAETKQSEESLKSVANTVAALNDFDRTRGRFESESAFFEKGQWFSKKITESDVHISGLLKAVDDFNNDRSAALLLALVDVQKALTDFDRERLRNTHQNALDAADLALRSLSESRTRLAKLFPIVTAAEGGLNAPIGRQLVETTAAITVFDEQIATPEQKDALQKARVQVQPLAWSFLKQKLDALAKSETPETLQGVVTIHRLVKSLPNGTLSEEQQYLLAKASAADEVLSASSDRLAALVSAADAWKNPRAMSRDLLSSYQAITALDKARFQDVHRQAWETLAKAEAILCGPKCGLTVANKSSVPIYVFSSATAEYNDRVAATLGDELRKAGFQVVTDQRDAALVADVTILGTPEPQKDYSGPQVRNVATANLKLTMTWIADDSIFYSDQAQESASSEREDDLRTRALLTAINTLRQRFQYALGKR